MAYIANNTWTDAANYGQGLGQTLSAALIQLPQQRAEMAMRLAQLQQMGSLRQAQMQFNQQRQSDLQQNREDVLGFKQNQLEASERQNQVLDAIRQLSVNNRGNYQEGQLDLGNRKLDNQTNYQQGLLNIGQQKADTMQQNADTSQERADKYGNLTADAMLGSLPKLGILSAGLAGSTNQLNQAQQPQIMQLIQALHQKLAPYLQQVQPNGLVAPQQAAPQTNAIPFDQWIQQNP